MKCKVLISDDERMWRETVLGDALRKEGYAVQVASSIEETLMLVEREYFHVIFADICFSASDHNNRDGVKTLEAAARWNEGTKTIVLTGYGTVDLAVKALKQLNVFDFMEKGESYDQNRLKATAKKAAELASISFVNKYYGIPVDALMPWHKFHQIAGKLHVKEEPLRWLVKHMFNEAAPVLTGESKSSLLRASDVPGSAVATGGGEYVLQQSLWSRMYGCALRMYVSTEAIGEQIVRACGDKVVASVVHSGAGVLVSCHDVPHSEFIAHS